MSVNQPEMLRTVLTRTGLGPIFCRHSFGMLRWVEIWGAKMGRYSDMEAKIVAGRLAYDNARHAKLFADRARALGFDPGSYRITTAGTATYIPLLETDDLPSNMGFAHGTLEHFTDLLELYASVADPESRRVLESVHADVQEERKMLGSILSRWPAGPEAERARAQATLAHQVYAEREDQEAKGYGAISDA